MDGFLWEPIGLYDQAYQSGLRGIRPPLPRLSPRDSSESRFVLLIRDSSRGEHDEDGVRLALNR